MRYSSINMICKLSLSIFIISLVFIVTDAKTVHAQNLEVSIDGQYGAFKPEASSYLGTQIGAGPNVFNFVEVDDSMEFKASNLAFRYLMPPNTIPKAGICEKFSGLTITGHFEKGRADDNQNFGTLDLGGDNLLIPGVGIGATGVGFFLPGPNNQITEGVYDVEFDYHKIMLRIETEYKTANPNLKIIPSFGVEYANTETTNRFGGNIPFFVRRFAYDTNFKTQSLSPTIGVKMSYDINPMLTFFGGAQYAYNFNKGSGEDSLSFTGFGTQSIAMNNRASTDSYGLQAGFDIDLDLPVKLSIEGSYRNVGNVPVMNVRTGSRAASFDYEDAKIFNGAVRLTYQF